MAYQVRYIFYGFSVETYHLVPGEHLFFFFFLFLAALWHMEFPGQRSDLSQLLPTLQLPDPLTHVLSLGIEPVSWHCRDATAVPKREL